MRNSRTLAGPIHQQLTVVDVNVAVPLVPIAVAVAVAVIPLAIAPRLVITPSAFPVLRRGVVLILISHRIVGCSSGGLGGGSRVPRREI